MGEIIRWFGQSPPLFYQLFLCKSFCPQNQRIFQYPFLSEPTLSITLFFFIIFICVEIVFLVTDSILANVEVVMAGSSDISFNIFASISVTFSVTSVTCFLSIKDFRYIFTRKSPSKSISFGLCKPYSAHSLNILGMPVPHFSIIFIYANAFAIAGFLGLE